MLEYIGEVIGVSLRSGMYLFGLVCGFGLGVSYAVLRRWWRDYKTSKALVKTTRKATIRSVPRVIKWGAIAGAAAIVAVAGMTAAAEEVPTTPASVPSGVPSSPAPTRSR